MSIARAESALAYVAAMRHGPKKVLRCRCERCDALQTVYRLACVAVALKRLRDRRTSKAKATA